MAPMSHRIFISHNHFDNDFGTKLAQDLRGVLADEDAVFYDVLGGLHGGKRWWNKIVEELTTRDMFPLGKYIFTGKIAWCIAPQVRKGKQLPLST